MRRFRKIAIGVLIALAAILVLQNTDQVVMHLLFWKVEAPTAILLAVTLLIGFVLGLLFVWRRGGPGKTSATS